MYSTTSAENADSFIFGGGIPEHRVLAADRLALSTSAPHTPVALVSSADTARSPRPGLHEDSGSCAQLFALLLIYSGHTVEARTKRGKSESNTFTFPISILTRVELLRG